MNICETCGQQLLTNTVVLDGHNFCTDKCLIVSDIYKNYTQYIDETVNKTKVPEEALEKFFSIIDNEVLRAYLLDKLAVRLNSEENNEIVNNVSMVPIISSNLESVGYDKSANDLIVQFKGGGKYKYLGVPNIIYEGFMKADSKGKYFAQNIKNGGYQFQKV